MDRLILHLPLIESLPDAAGRLPALLLKVLARARRMDRPESESLAFNLQSPPLPAPAVLSRLSDPDHLNDDPGSWWLRFDPVRLVPDLTSVWVDRTMPLDFSASELRPVADELQRMFEAEGLGWKAAAGGFGLLALDEDPGCSFLPPDQVHGQRLDEVLPAGPGAARWRRLINESQMIFHQFRPMGRADQQGVGLWFWGTGRTTHTVPGMPPLRVVDRTGNAMVRGLGRWLGAAVEDSSTGFDECRESTCYVHWPLQGAGIDEPLARLVEEWLAPALRAQGRGRLGRIVIMGSSGDWQLGRLDRAAFWRRTARGLAAEEAGA